MPGIVLAVWITGVGGWVGLWHDSVQWWREAAGVVPGVCAYTVRPPSGDSTDLDRALIREHIRGAEAGERTLDLHEGASPESQGD